MLIPKQHGAWAMLIIPFFLSMIAGGITIWHLLLFMGWLFLYLASFPLMMVTRKKKNKDYKKWLFIYSLLAFICLLPILWVQMDLAFFGFAMIPTLLINVYFAKQNNERAFTNDIVAIISFCIGGLASFYLGAGQLTKTAWIIFFLSFLFFLGTTFYVKTMIREKKNIFFKYLSWGYHLLLPIILFSLHMEWAIIAFVPSILRALLLYGRKLSIMKIGVIEIVNAVFFLVSILLLW